MKCSAYSVWILLFVFACSGKQQNPVAKVETQLEAKSVSNMDSKKELKREATIIKSSDGLSISTDLYMIEDKDAPYIILFHQAGYSRGEYREIAPKLNALGFNCVAIDQRSGKEVNGIENETFKEATKMGMKTKFIDAIPDLEAALKYVKDKLKAKKVILWGSSYSSSLVFYLSAQNADKVDGMLAFSPGEYFTIEGKKFDSFASNVKCPVFVTSAKSEEDSWKPIYDNVKSEKSFFLPKVKGNHGSRALWESKDEHEDYWKAVEKFLGQWMK